MFKKILIANRGEIALRIIRACKEMGIKSVAVYSEADELSLHTKFADEAICIGPSIPKKSYLNISAIISAAELTDCDAIHPGYGFLSEKSEFSKICKEHNIAFIGPESSTIDLMGNKSEARKLADSLDVPIIPGTKDAVPSLDEAISIANEIQYPVIIKAVSGGGGKGMRIVNSDNDLKNNYDIAKSEALNSFNDDRVYIEKYLTNPRHIEVQIMADKFGNVYTLGDRDCSIQRNHQKIIEEAPSISINPNLEVRLLEDSIKIAKKCNYLGVGTVEFLVSGNEYYFIEMNTRIQVEHTVTEMIYSYDLIKGQILIHSGEKISDDLISAKSKGHAIECRINAEDPSKNFQPSPGTIGMCHQPSGFRTRVDGAIYQGYKITPYYDSMICKLICHGRNRTEAIQRMNRSLDEFVIEGITTTIDLHKKLLNHKKFINSDFNVTWLDKEKII